MVFRSVMTRKRATWRLPPFGAFAAASRTRWRSSAGIGSGLKRRMARWVKIASPTDIDSRLGSALTAFSSHGGGFRDPPTTSRELARADEDPGAQAGVGRRAPEDRHHRGDLAAVVRGVVGDVLQELAERRPEGPALGVPVLDAPHQVGLPQAVPEHTLVLRQQ